MKTYKYLMMCIMAASVAMYGCSSDDEPNKEEQKREKAISNYQRQLEREIRNAKDSAIAFKNIELDKYLPKALQVAKKQKYLEYKAKADKLTREYVEFCHKYNRVEYRSRLQV